MTKTWQTKKKILKLVSKDAKTPGEISQELGLAPSTVSEHMEELERMGAVKPVDNPFIKKWKYYRANPDFDVQSIANLRRVSNIPQIAAALAILLGFVAFLAFGMSGLGTVGVGHSVVFSLTDPPSVPSGTQALNITYSSLRAHYIGANNTSAWVSGSGSGSLDLMSLINASQVIGTGSVPANSVINTMSFAITSAYIVINGTRYNITVPSGNLMVPVTGGGKITSNSSVLIDLSPVVTTIYTNNSAVFVLVPSVKAVFVGSANESAQVGARHQLTEQEHLRLNATTPAIAISSASFKVISNSTVELTVTVKNNANESVDLRHVILSGLPAVFVSTGTNDSVGAEINARPTFLNGSIGAGASASASMLGGSQGDGEGEPSNAAVNVGAFAHGMVNGNAVDRGNGSSEAADIINGVHVTVFGNGIINATTHMPMLSANEASKLGNLVSVGAQVRSLRVLNFIVTSNGTLALPFLSNICSCAGRFCPMEDQASIACIAQDEVSGNRFGYTLQPGASVNLTFSGTIDYANNHIQITPVVGSQWRLAVQGENGASANTNVTVTGG